MVESYEYCIIGGGIVGSSAAYILSRTGASVVLFEQFELGHDKGSSHGDSRIIRYSYDHPIYVRMSKLAYPLWHEIMKESGEELLVKTGGIDLDEEQGKRVSACIASLKEERVEHEILSAAEIQNRFPQFHIPAHTTGLYQSDTGLLNAARCVKTLQKLAQSHGAILRDSSPISKIEYESKYIYIYAGEKKFKIKKLILACGGWMGPLLAGMGLRLALDVSQEQYAFFKPQKPELFMPGEFPIFIHYDTSGMGWYGLPIYGKDGIKSSVHRTGKSVNASQRDFQVDEKLIELLKKLMQKVLPDAAGEIFHTATCLYTNSSDTHFIIDHPPGRENTVFFTGCSGHAFKFGPVIAQMMIGLLNKEPPLVPMNLFSRKRFS